MHPLKPHVNPLRHRTTGTLFALALLIAPAAAAAQTCIGNPPQIERFSTVQLSTGGVTLAPDGLGLHMVGITHHTDEALFGLGQNVYRVEYGALTGLENGSDYQKHAYRATARWLFDFPLPSAAPEALDLCWTIGTKIAFFGYVMNLDAVTADNDVAAWYFGWGFPVTANAGYRISLNESFDLVPYVAPGLNPNWGGLLADESVHGGTHEDLNELTTGIDYFTAMGVALNHELFRVGLFLESGMEEVGGTRVGLEGGIAW